MDKVIFLSGVIVGVACIHLLIQAAPLIIAALIVAVLVRGN